MSHIFDALQRAETERGRTRVRGATELLQRAEREAATERHTGRSGRGATAVRVMPPPTQEMILEVQDDFAADAAGQDGNAEDSVSRVLEGFGVLEAEFPLESRLVCLTDRDSAAAEAFRLLGVRLRDLRRNRPLQKLLITSTVPAEGKSTVAANLATTLALGTQQPVLLLEGDVRRPTLLNLFRLPESTGLCDWLHGDCKLKECIWRLKDSGIWILPAGSAPDDPLALMQSARLTELLEQLAGWFEWIVIDSPPVLPLADTSVWTRVADGILLVARRGITRRKQLQRGVEALDARKLIGAVMNSATGTSDRDYYYYGRKPAAANAKN